jgi:hypothetical protein
VKLVLAQVGMEVRVPEVVTISCPPVRELDFTDHGMPKEHPNPHQHVRGPEPNPGAGRPKGLRRPCRMAPKAHKDRSGGWRDLSVRVDPRRFCFARGRVSTANLMTREESLHRYRVRLLERRPA